MFHVPIFCTALARCVTALSSRGIDPWPDVPVATSRTRLGTFSVVAICTRRTRPSSIVRAWTLAQRELRVDLVEMPLDQETDTHAGRVGLLAGFGEKDQIALEGHAGALHEQERHQVGGKVVLVVGRAPAPHIAITQNGSERIHRPLVTLHANDVGVRQEQQRPLRAVALQPRDQIWPVGIEGEVLDGIPSAARIFWR